MASPTSIRDRLASARKIALIVGVAGVVLAVIGWFVSDVQFFRSYLMAYVLWWEVAIGCLALAMLYQLTGGRWGRAGRPFFEAGARTLMLLTLLFVPIAFGLPAIFDWADPSWRAQSHLNPNRMAYLSPSGALWRAAAYFLVWLVLTFVLTRRRRNPTVEPEARLEGISGIGLVLLVLSVTFAGMDWLMSLEPHYKSTMFGGIVMAGAGVAGIAAVTACVALIPGQPTLPTEHRRQVLNDFGNLMLAFVMVWTYVVFGQYLITWMGNLPEEVMWFEARQVGAWEGLIVAVIALHFVVPFFTLLFRDAKQAPRWLAGIAVLVLVMRYAYVFWTAAPSWYGEFGISWLDVVMPVAIGGLWVAEYLRQLEPRLMPYLEEEGRA